jgi:tetratricopeptide (TPR) repeat protein
MGRIARHVRIALGLILAGGTLAPGPARAQSVQSSLTLNGRTFALSPLELDRLTALAHVVHTLDRGAQDRALEAARSVANGADGRYVLALYQLEIGRQRHDDGLRAQALDVLIADRQTPRDKLLSYLGPRGDIAFRSGDYATASSLWGRLLELQPDDPQAAMNLAQVRAAQQDAAGAIALIRRAIAAPRTGAPPETWYRQWLSIAFNAHLLDQCATAGQALVSAYPTPENWRHALATYRQLAAPQEGAEIDLLRLMRVAGVLIQSAEYLPLAQLLEHAGLPLEGKAVLEEGIARGTVNRAEPPVPAIIAEIDRVISRQGNGPGPARAPSNQAAPPEGQGSYRQAAALALAGRRPEAEAAFRALSQNAGGEGLRRFYPDLASFWLDWLARSG